MSKFSDLIQKKNEMLKVTMKVDPAACKNGEITHFKEYVGFVLAEKEFEKTYEKLLKQYTLQNEGFFDSVLGAIKAVGRKLKDDIVKPFKDSKYNPFVGYGDKPVDKTESGQIITVIESDWLDVNKKIYFVTSNYGIQGKTFEELNSEYSSSTTKKKEATKKETKENYTYSDLTNTLLEKINISPNPRLQTNVNQRATQQNAPKPTQQVPQLNYNQSQPKKSQKQQKAKKPVQSSKSTTVPNQKANQSQPPKEPNYVSIIRKGIAQTDLNNQISVRNMDKIYIPVIQKKIKEENAKRKEMREPELKVTSQDVWKSLVQKVENYFKASRDSANVEKKILWAYILAQPNRKINISVSSQSV